LIGVRGEREFGRRATCLKFHESSPFDVRP
jgi:hypothetical protein